MWSYVLHGNDSQCLKRSKPEYDSQEDAMAEGGKMAMGLAQHLGIILSVQAGRIDHSRVGRNRTAE